MSSTGSHLEHPPAAGRRLCALAALLLTPLLALTLLLPWLAPPSGGGGETAGLADAEGAAALANWERLWSAVDERGAEALAPEIADPSLRAAGDTAFMRYRNLWGEVPPATRRAFQLAALSSEPAQKLALLSPLRDDPEPRIAARATLEIARVQLRQRALTAATATAEALLAIPGLDPRLRADAEFILASAAFDSGALDPAEAALGRAVESDPGYWDARQLELLVLSRQLARPGQRPGTCVDRTRRLIETLGALPALAQDRGQFRDIADRFARSGAPDNAAFALLSALGYQWAGDPERAQRALDGIAQTRGRLPAACEELILERAREYSR